MNSCSLNNNCFCCKFCSAVFPFFSDGDFEYKTLIFYSSFYVTSNANIRYDNYLSPTKLSELTGTLVNNYLYLVHFSVRSLPRNLNKIEQFLKDMST